LFWHEEWEDFFDRCSTLSSQFVHYDISSLTAFPGEDVSIRWSTGGGVTATVDGANVDCPAGICTVIVPADGVYEKPVTVTAGTGHSSTIYLNMVPSYDDMIRNRTHFIVNRQQIDSSANASISGAYIVYDNQVERMITFEASVDRNSARERIGMGVLLARWLLHHPDEALEQSLIRYYKFVCERIQDSDGYVWNGPIGSGDTMFRLYNWPWVMQLHLLMHGLNLDLTASVEGPTPLERFIRTVKNYYSNGGAEFYSIGVPVFEGLQVLSRQADQTGFETVKKLFTGHALRLAERGTNYPPHEVNFEQSIVAPAANFLLEMYRFTRDSAYLTAARPHVDLLLLFGGRQPDYRLYDVAIRHWDGYWFGKDRIWGDTFPHYWSTLTALTMHHFAKASEDVETQLEFDKRADGVLRANLALFTADGRGSCAWMYPLTVNGRDAHYKDPYANDQDWALAHVLQIRDEGWWEMDRQHVLFKDTEDGQYRFESRTEL
jgi:hypothetical protein